MDINRLHQWSEDEAVQELLRCCGSLAWARQMSRRRPFASRDELMKVADEIWWSLGEEDHLEAFAAHPPIGTTSRTTSAWSSAEQAGVAKTPEVERQRLAHFNEEYYRKFGFVFLICATGKTGSEVLSALERRLGNDIATELEIAATEQAKITKLRLEKLL